MSELAVITPTYAPDLELFADLHRSVLTHTPDDTVHHVIVPSRDRGLFARFEGPRCRLWIEPELLPRTYFPIPLSRLWLNVARPWPPIRGWILQQSLKLAAAARMEADAVLVADSDIVLVRPVRLRDFMVGGRLRLHRIDHGVHPGMRRHLLWHEAARRLLGRQDVPDPPLHDYVNSLTLWDPAAVRALQDRIEKVTGRRWQDAFSARLHISEFILYGVFVDELLGAPAASDTGICHNYWDATPLSMAEALAFADRLDSRAVGMMISAKSGTTLDVRRAAISRCLEVARQRPCR
ncbi:DUF6492 family protein [Sphaerimonospora sp. CA-214678]|uniref:DUF6492 family protein n=1 Tax=Sphaerimonospora sp. CA-214678 TaxID=3240029 RepID=UPI003D8F9A01